VRKSVEELLAQKQAQASPSQKPAN
jgi:hypothetical protein